MLLLKLALHFLLREWRAGELKILLAGIMLAVACLATLTFIVDRMQQGLNLQRSELLGGDRVITSTSPPPKTWQAYANSLGLTTSLTAEFNSMVIAGEQLQLATIKAVANPYPLLGQFQVTPSNSKQRVKIAHGPAPGEIWPEARLLAALKLNSADNVNIGLANFRIGYTLTQEPDVSISWSNLAPRLLMNYADLAKAQIVSPGSRVEYRFLVTGPDKSLNSFLVWLKPQLQSGQKVIDSKDQSRLDNTLKQIQFFLQLGGLICILLAGVAIAATTHRYSQRHYHTNSLLRCLGLKQNQLLWLYSYQFLIIGAIGTCIGCLIGFWGQIWLAKLVEDLIPLALPAPQIVSFLTVCITSMLLLFIFVLPPILNLRDISPLGIFRHELKPRSASNWAIYAFGSGGILALLVIFTSDLKLSLIVTASLGFLLILLGLITELLIFFCARLRPHLRGGLRYALANVIRHQATHRMQILVFGLLIMITLILCLLRYNLFYSWQQRLPKTAPNYFIINILADDVPALQQLFAKSEIKTAGFYPLVRGRITQLNGQEVLSAIPPANRNFNALRREINLSWQRQIPSYNNLLSGSWWQKEDTGAWVSVELRLAEALGLKLGDELTLNAGGELLRAKVKNIRAVDWYSFQPNFYLLFSPNVLADLPATYITSFYLPEQQTDFILNLAQQFPSISLIDLSQTLAQVQQIMATGSRIIGYLLILSLGASLLILLSSIQATLDLRCYEAAILRALGMSRLQLQRMIGLEFFLQGLLAGLLGCMAALLASFAITHYIFKLDFLVPLPLVSLCCAGSPLLLGIIGFCCSRTIVSRNLQSSLQQVSAG